MGAWGYEPYANDTACDFFAVAFQNSLPDAVNGALDSGCPDKVRAAAFILERVGFGYVWPLHAETLQKAVDRIIQLQENDNWILEWDEPDRMRVELKRQHTELRLRLNRDGENVLMAQVYKSMGHPLGWDVYDALEWCVETLEQVEDLPEGKLESARALLETSK